MKHKEHPIEWLVNNAWRWFISLKLTFGLLVLIATGAILGMSFDQTKTYDEFLAAQADGFKGQLISFLELNDAFHSWWFSLAILLLALNLIACSIERLPRIYFDYQKPRPYLTKRRRLGLNLVERVEASSYDQARKLVAQFMPRALMRAELGRSDFFFVDKYSFARFGVYVVHIALLIIMFSAIYATQNGVDGHILIEEGGRERLVSARGPSGVTYNYNLGFYVGCDDFRLRTFIDNSPMEYESDLYIEDGGQRIITKTVRVNEPLSYKGFTFYQSTFQPRVSEREVTLEITERGGGQRDKVRLKLMQPFTLATNDTMVVQKIYDDFAGLGQALRIGKKNQQGLETYFHIFRRHPDYDARVRNDSFSVKFIDADQLYATGLSVGYVPGISIIFAGFLLFLLGLFLCFFLTPIRYFAHIEQEQNGYVVWFAAQGFRHHQLVKDDFYQRMSTIRRA